MFRFTLLLTFALAVQVNEIFPLGKPPQDLNIRVSRYIDTKSQSPITDGAKLGFGSVASSMNSRPGKKPSGLRKGRRPSSAIYRRH
ncbi:hypothetical protein DSO57_1033259 [Entomophthora muscae]|uniref:Uncharacterized protein n=1 Tax=Entomophthora muscae TaxID=34485 RepID=A0ACC2TYP4_9FUNG|nr:hypothetical protein DSO57_1033259 [Entomophthora muscae]